MAWKPYIFSDPRDWRVAVYRIVLLLILVAGFVLVRRGQVHQGVQLEEIATAVATAEP